MPQPDEVPFDWRSGVIQAIGIILGFSLGFLGDWSMGEGDWRLIHLPALTFLFTGNGFLVLSLYKLTAPRARVAGEHARVAKIFTLGVLLTLIGFVLAIAAAWITDEY